MCKCTAQGSTGVLCFPSIPTSQVRGQDDRTIKWRCTRRQRGEACPARVTQVHDSFFVDVQHCWKADPSLQVHIALYALAKQKIRGDVFLPVNDVVEPLMFKAYKAIPRKQR